MPVITTVDEVRSTVAAIEQLQWDPEAAHSLEDDLYKWVLQAIAEGAVEHEEAQEMAEAALQTKAFDFPRYTA